MADETVRVTIQDEAANPPGDGSLATRRVEDAGTRRVAEGDAATRRVDSASMPEEGLPLGLLAPGTVLCGEYRVQRTLFPHESQRPGLFLCEGPEGQVVVKVAATRFPPKPELWQRLPFLIHPHVLRTHRVMEAAGRSFDVQEFCPGGTLEQRVPHPGSGFPPVSADWIMRTFVPQMHAALAYLHAQEVIHRDIKPANIYVKAQDGRETLVLADFDISSVLEEHRTSRDTQRAAGTWLYTAPEAFPRFVDDHASSKRGRVTRSSDYYSLAVTAIELLMGTTSLHLCQLPDLFDFYLQGGRVEIPQGIPGRLALLLRGLLIRNRHTRWGAAEIERWLVDANTEDDHRRIYDDENFELARASRPYRLNDRYAIDLASLAEAMFQEQEIATEDLITGDVLLNWIGNLDVGVAREIRRDRDRHYPTPDRVLHQAIMRCDPTRPFVFADGAEAITPGEWMAHAIRVARGTTGGVEAFCTPALLQALEAWLRLKLNSQPPLADAVAEIERTDPRLRLEELAYLFEPNRPYVIAHGLAARTPQELVRLTYGPAEGWSARRPVCYDASYQRWHDGALCAWLRQRGLKALADQCDEVRAELAEQPYAAFETILRLLDPNLPPVRVALDLTEVAFVRAVPYGEQRTYRLRYTAHGPGMPFGALTLQADSPGVQLGDHLVRDRQGTVEVTIDTRQGMKVFTTFQAAIDIDSGIAVLADAPARFGYRAIYPHDHTLKRVLLGAGIGALVLGVPRILLSVFGVTHPVTLADWHVRTLWEDITVGRLPLGEFIFGFLVLFACLYVGLRIWFDALRRSET